MSRLLQTPFTPTTPHNLRKPTTIQRLALRPSYPQIQSKIREIFMPALSSTMAEGKIVSWVKSEGDKLSKGESVVVVESDKADMDVETFYDGYLAAIIVDEGGVAPVGSAIALLAESESEISEAKTRASSSCVPAPPTPADPTSNNAAPALPAASTAAAPPPLAAVALGSAMHPASEGGKRIVASPYAKKLAKELNVELVGIVGSGPSGRIVAKDVEAAASAMAVGEVPSAAAPVMPEKKSGSPEVELGAVVPFTTMQGAVSRNMVESLSVPTFRVGYTITTDALDALYKKVD